MVRSLPLRFSLTLLWTVILQSLVTTHAFTSVHNTFARSRTQLWSSTAASSSSSSASPSKLFPPAISIDGLTCSHDGGGTYQLQDINYVLPRGGKVGLVGRNGCGKVCLERNKRGYDKRACCVSVQHCCHGINASMNTMVVGVQKRPDV